MLENIYIKKYFYFIMLALIIFTANYLIILFFPQSSGDGATYLKVAENIFYNQCISVSIPESKECIPHWGSNQGPLYPLFISLCWFLFGKNLASIYFSQLFILVFSILLFIKNFQIRNYKQFLIILLFIVLSLNTLGWSRYILTESLSISLSFLVLNQIFKILEKKTINIIPIVIFFTLGFFLRYDFLLWIIPIFSVCLFSFERNIFIKNFLIGLLIFLLFIFSWSVRNINNGLSIIPGGSFGSQFVTHDEFGYRLDGYIDWVETWSWNNYMYPSAVYPLDGYNYKKIIINENAYTDNQEKKVVQNLLNDLKKNYQGKPMPEYINAVFKKIAEEKTTSLNKFIVLPFKRFLAMSFNPFTSMGLPFNIDNQELKEKILENKKIDIFNLLKNNYAAVLTKSLSFIYRIILYSLILYLLFNFKNIDTRIKVVLFSCVLLFFIRTYLFSLTYLNATRHLIQPMIFFESIIVYYFLTYKYKKS